MLLSPGLGEAWEAGSLGSGPRSVIALLCDLGQPPYPHPVQSLHLYRELLAIQDLDDSPEKRCP